MVILHIPDCVVYFHSATREDV